MHDPYSFIAARINALQEGRAIRIAREEIADLPGLPDWAAFANITTGFDRVKESVIGSDHSDLWHFREEWNGDITVFRLHPKGG